MYFGLQGSQEKSCYLQQNTLCPLQRLELKGIVSTFSPVSLCLGCFCCLYSPLMMEDRSVKFIQPCGHTDWPTIPDLEWALCVFASWSGEVATACSTALVQGSCSGAPGLCNTALCGCAACSRAVWHKVAIPGCELGQVLHAMCGAIQRALHAAYGLLFSMIFF